MLLLATSLAHAGWYCSEVSSEWVEKGKTLSACGIGKGADENSARLDASNNARKEFSLVCDKETSCANKVINIDPQRTECTSNEGVFTCHRLFYYHITDKERRPQESEVAPVVIEKKATKIEYKTDVHNKIQNVTNNNFITVNQPVIKEIVRQQMDNGYRSLVRVEGRVSIYSTNSKKYQGVYLTNPTEQEIEQEVKRGNRSGGMNAVYLYNP